MQVAIGEAKTEKMTNLGYDLLFNINLVLAVFEEGGEAAVIDFLKGRPYLGNVWEGLKQITTYV